jgi:hypothetical protein
MIAAPGAPDSTNPNDNLIFAYGGGPAEKRDQCDGDPTNLQCWQNKRCDITDLECWQHHGQQRGIEAGPGAFGVGPTYVGNLRLP